jgi:thiol-disulfide isomerase/thioredoxin
MNRSNLGFFIFQPTGPTPAASLRWAGLVAALVFVFSTAARAQIKVGDVFPALTDEALEGTIPETAGKVVLVDFWASWCAPCKASFPAYGRMQADFAPRGLTIVAVSVDETAAPYAAFVKKMAPPFATVRDAKQKLVSAVKVPAMPTSYLIGPDGKVRYVHQGFHSAGTESEIRKEIEGLLAEKPSSPSP